MGLDRNERKTLGAYFRACKVREDAEDALRRGGPSGERNTRLRESYAAYDKALVDLCEMFKDQ